MDRLAELLTESHREFVQRSLGADDGLSLGAWQAAVLRQAVVDGDLSPEEFGLKRAKKD